MPAAPARKTRTSRTSRGARLAPAPDPEPLPRAPDPITERGAQLDAAYRVFDASCERAWDECNAEVRAAWDRARAKVDDAGRHYAAQVATIREGA
jgi:hypothetical protein